jgi:hypothetical protein
MNQVGHNLERDRAVKSVRSFQSTGGDTRSCKLVNQSLPTNLTKEKAMAKQMKDDLQKWMDKHLVVMTLSDDKKQEKKIKKAIQNKVRESLTTENKNA